MCFVHMYFSQNLDNTIIIIYIYNISGIFLFSSCLENMICAGLKQERASFWDHVLVGWSKCSQPQAVLSYEWSWVDKVLSDRESCPTDAPQCGKWSWTHAIMPYRWSSVEQVPSDTCSPALQMILGIACAFTHMQSCPTDSPGWSRYYQKQIVLQYQWGWVG